MKKTGGGGKKGKGGGPKRGAKGDGGKLPTVPEILDLNQKALRLYYDENPTAAAELYSECIRKARQISHTGMLCSALKWRGKCYNALGRLREAAEDLLAGKPYNKLFCGSGSPKDIELIRSWQQGELWLKFVVR